MEVKVLLCGRKQIVNCTVAKLLFMRVKGKHIHTYAHTEIHNHQNTVHTKTYNHTSTNGCSDDSAKRGIASITA